MSDYNTNRLLQESNRILGQIVRAVTILPKIHAELKLANDLKAYELSKSNNTAEISLVHVMVDQARGE